MTELLEKSADFDFQALADAQKMAEWFSDYVYGFSDTVGNLPSVTTERLNRQFGHGDPAKQLERIRDVLMMANPDYQPAIALYTCGFPDDAFEGLSDIGYEETVRELDRLVEPPKKGVARTMLGELSLVKTVPDTTPVKMTRPEQRRQPELQDDGEIRPILTTREIADKDLVGMYLEEIGRIPLLTAIQEVELAKTIEAGLYAEKLLSGEHGEAPDGASREELEWLAAEGKRAVDTFISSNTRLVVSIARKYTYRVEKLGMIDLIQEGSVGLIRAVEKFDYTKGYKFSTYATWWVRQAITRGIFQQERTVRLPVHIEEDINKARQIERHLQKQLGIEPTYADIAAEMDVEESYVQDIFKWSTDTRGTSLDQAIDDDGETSLGDLIADDRIIDFDEQISDEQRAQGLTRLHELVERHLKPREADIILSRFGLRTGSEEQLASIGRRHGISAERVRQLQREALETLQARAREEVGKKAGAAS